jgi:hypothetical protein
MTGMRVTCEVCGKLYVSDEPAPYLCAFCDDEIFDQEMAEWEAKARAAGYPSFDAYVEAQQPGIRAARGRMSGASLWLTKPIGEAVSPLPTEASP